MITAQVIPAACRTSFTALPAQHHALLVTIEENVVMGGAGSAVNEALHAAGITCAVINLGLPDQFIEQGSPSQLLAQCGLDAAGIVGAVRAKLKINEKM